MNSIVILQARTTSSRLPAKVLLPVGGLPVVVLAAMRACNTGRNLVVVTSGDSSDDGLVEILQSYSLNYFRGSLENTLERVVDCLEGYDDDLIVIRLTADNVFPDGKLLDEIEEEFLNRNIPYMCCNGENSGLPYGVSVEITRLYYLREAKFRSASIYEQEHVTPYIIKKYGVTYFDKYKHLKKGVYRCTIDSLDDYLVVQSVFSKSEDAVFQTVLSLVKFLEEIQGTSIIGVPAPKLVLGAAQLGLDYGIANTSGKPSQSQCNVLIKTAISSGIKYIDTASDYGESESVIGIALQAGWKSRVEVITKLSKLKGCPDSADENIVGAYVDASIYKSLASLRLQKIEVLLMHISDQIFSRNGFVWKRLKEHLSFGLIGALGVSVQNPEELMKVLEIPEIEHIQLPFNLLDWRWDESIVKIRREKEKRKLVIHVRSVLLQGLLISSHDDHWLYANAKDPGVIRGWLQSQVNIHQRRCIADLCIAYVNAHEWIDGIVIGVDKIDQLQDNILLFGAKPMNKEELIIVHNSRPILSELTLNPSLWGGHEKRN